MTLEALLLFGQHVFGQILGVVDLVVAGDALDLGARVRGVRHANVVGAIVQLDGEPRAAGSDGEAEDHQRRALHFCTLRRRQLALKTSLAMHSKLRCTSGVVSAMALMTARQRGAKSQPSVSAEVNEKVRPLIGFSSV